MGFIGSLAPSLLELKRYLDNTLRYRVSSEFGWSCVELGLVILVGLSQLSIIYDSRGWNKHVA